MENIQSKPFGSETERRSANRSRLYSFFAEAFRYPDELFRGQAKQGKITEVFASLTGELPYPFGLEATEAEALRIPGWVREEDIEVEFVRLFEAGPGGPPCPLVEGAWREDRKVVLKELILFYNHFGLSYAEGAQDERPDHICLEMEFLHYLTFKEVQALQTGADPSGYRRAERDFLERHPRSWMGKVSERLEKICERIPEDVCKEAIAFYRQLVNLACRFFDQERLYLQTLLAAQGQ
jgi:putative dimethyl sulfoxide reductase chaperone